VRAANRFQNLNILRDVPISKLFNNNNKQKTNKQTNKQTNKKPKKTKKTLNLVFIKYCGVRQHTLGTHHAIAPSLSYIVMYISGASEITTIIKYILRVNTN
jgi:hypothetical protein